MKNLWRRFEKSKRSVVAVWCIAVILFALAFQAHEAWPDAAVGSVTAVFIAIFGGLTLYNYLWGTHRGHPVYARLAAIYAVYGLVFYVRSCGLLLGPLYWIVGAGIILGIWLIVRPYQDQIAKDRRDGTRKSFF
jgi:hypothetical protein